MLKSEWKDGKSRSIGLVLDWENETAGFEVTIYFPGSYTKHTYATFAEAIRAYRACDHEFGKEVMK